MAGGSASFFEVGGLERRRVERLELGFLLDHLGLLAHLRRGTPLRRQGFVVVLGWRRSLHVLRVRLVDVDGRLLRGLVQRRARGLDGRLRNIQRIVLRDVLSWSLGLVLRLRGHNHSLSLLVLVRQLVGFLPNVWVASIVH